MSKSYTVGFENVELVDGLAPEKPVWLYLRATLLNQDDTAGEHPLWIDEVGSLPPDANRPGYDAFPHGDAGRYAEGLAVAIPTTNKSVMGLSNFSVGPVAVGPGQTLEVIVIMLPRVWTETVSVPAETLDRLGYGVLGAAIGFAGGPAGAIAGLLYGLFAPHDQDVDVPCFNSVIMARHTFSAADLDAIETAGIERFGPQDNEAYVVCHQPIDAYYSLTVNAQGYGFASLPPPRKELCTLEPRAYQPARDQVEQAWGDVGDGLSDCVQLSVVAQSSTHADVEIRHRTGAGFAVVARFSNVRITRGVPHPDFQRNFFDDNCPARAAKPDCPDCLRFVNLSLSMIVDKSLLYLGMLPGSHVGTRPVFPVQHDTDHVTVERHATRNVCTAVPKHGMASTEAVAGTATAEHASGAPGTTDEAYAAGRAASLPARLGTRHLAQAVSRTHARLWPTGTLPVRDSVGGHRVHDLFVEHDIYLPEDLGISWQLVCSPEFTLSTYQELTGEGGCRGRLRYTRRDATGQVIADVMMSRQPIAPR